jgi:hypothetical protein
MLFNLMNLFLKTLFSVQLASVILIASVLNPARAQLETKPKGLDTVLDEINLYTLTTKDQPTSISSFGDIYPSDWAYQALRNLVESYGCIAGFPDGTFKGNHLISRYEAASLLIACLENVTQITDELRALIHTFEPELKVLKGRVDHLEAQVDKLKAVNFSTTTKLKVNMGWLLGGTQYTGLGAKAVSSGMRNVFLPNANNGINNGPGFPTDGLDFVYASRFDLDTSFTGKDLLKLRIEVGNMTNSSFGINTATPLSLYAWFFPKGQADNQLVVQRANYTFPIGNKLTLTAGPIVRQDELLGSWPVRYPTNAPLFGVPWYAGAPAAYNLNQGAGGAITYREKFVNSTMSATMLYISRWGQDGNSGQGGIGTASSAAITTAQLGFSGTKWTAAAIYTYSQDNYASANSQGTPAYYSIAISNPMHSYGLAAFYDFNADSSLAPTLNLGAGYNQHVNDQSSRSVSWWLGLMWKDTFIKGHSFGLSTGQPTFITNENDNNADDGNYFMEAFYTFSINDWITFTPTLLWLSRPYGQQTKQITGSDSFGTLAAFIKTGIRF